MKLCVISLILRVCRSTFPTAKITAQTATAATVAAGDDAAEDGESLRKEKANFFYGYINEILTLNIRKAEIMGPRESV